MKIAKRTLIIGGVVVGGLVAVAGTVVALKYRTTKVTDDDGNIPEPVRRISAGSRITIYELPQSNRLFVGIGDWKSPGVSHTHVEGEHIPVSVLEHLFKATLDSAPEWTHIETKPNVLSDMNALYMWHYRLDKPPKWSRVATGVTGTPPNLNTDTITYSQDSKPYSFTTIKPVVDYVTSYWRGEKSGSMTKEYPAGTTFTLTDASIAGFRASQQKVTHRIMISNQEVGEAFNKAFALYIPEPVGPITSGGGAGIEGTVTTTTPVSTQVAVTTATQPTPLISGVSGISGSSALSGAGTIGPAQAYSYYGTIIPFGMPKGVPAQVQGQRQQVDPMDYKPAGKTIIGRIIQFLLWNRKWSGPVWTTDQVGDKVTIGCTGNFKTLNDPGNPNNKWKRTGSKWWVDIDGWRSKAVSPGNRDALYAEVAKNEGRWNPGGAKYQYPSSVMSGIKKYLNYNLNTILKGKDACYVTPYIAPPRRHRRRTCEELGVSLNSQGECIIPQRLSGQADVWEELVDGVWRPT